jgi:Transposase
MNYIGIDIHKKYSVACAQEAGKVIKRVRIEGNSAEGFRRCLNGDGEPARAVIEASWNWGKVYDTLEGIQGIEEIVLAHPLKTRLIADAQIKTDKIDAAALATLLRGNLVARALCLAKPRGCVRTSCVSGFTGRRCAHEFAIGCTPCLIAKSLFATMHRSFWQSRHEFSQEVAADPAARVSAPAR